MRKTSNLRKGFVAVMTGAILTMVCALAPNPVGAVPHIMVPPQTDTLYTVPAPSIDVEIFEGDTDADIPETAKSIAVGYQGLTNSISVDSNWSLEPTPQWVKTDLWSGETLNKNVRKNASLVYDVAALTPGDYAAQLTFSSDPSYVDEASIYIGLTVKSAYKFGLNPSRIDSLTPVNTPVTTNLALSNSSGSGRDLPFTLTMLDGSTEFPSWLILSQTSGTLTGSPLTIVVKCDPEDRTIGDSESCTLLLSTSESKVEENNIPIPVTMSVISPEGDIRIVARPSSIRAQSYETDPAPSSKIQVTNISVMNLDYEAVTTGELSLSVDPAVGQVPSKETISLDVNYPNAPYLEVGTYNGSVEITTTTVVSSNEPIVVPVTLEVLPSWGIGMTPMPPSDSYTKTVGFSRREQTSFVLFNSSLSNKEMNFEIENGENTDWLKFATRSGRVTNRNRMPITVTYDSTGYAPGTYEGTFTVRGSSVQNPSRQVELVVNVCMNVFIPEPNELGDFNPKRFDITIYETDNASTRRFNIVNPTSMILDYVTSASTATDPAWILTPDPASGMIRNNTLTSVRLNFNTSFLTPGEYPGKVQVTTTSLSTYNEYIKELPVNLTVKPGFRIATNKSAIEESIPKGDAFDSKVRIWNSATDKPMKYTVSTTVPWILLTKTEGIVTWNNRDEIPYRLETLNLAGGIYEGAIVIVAESADMSGHPAVNNSVSIPVKIHVTNEPGFSTNNLKQTMVYGEKNPDNVTFDVWNERYDKMAFTVTKSTVSNWFSVSPTYNISSGPNDRKTVSVSFNSQGLKPGTYTGQICVNVPSGNVINTYINVVLTVLSAREIGILPTKLSFTVPVGMERSLDWNLWNQRPNDPMSYTLVSSSDWVTLDKTVGTVTDTPTTIKVTASAKGKTAGTYTSSVIIYADGATNSPREVSVKMLVVQESTIETDPAELLAFSIADGETSTVRLKVKNAAGAVPMQFYMATDCSWLTPKQVTAIAQEDGVIVDFLAETEGLKEGTYEGNIRLTVPDGSCTNSPYILPVKMTITGFPLNIALSPSSLTLSHYEYEVPQYAIAIWNDGASSETSMPFSLTSTVRWMTVTPVSGIATAAKQYFIITVNTLELLPGYTYKGNIVITASNAGNSPRILPVTLELKAR